MDLFIYHKVIVNQKALIPLLNIRLILKTLLGLHNTCTEIPVLVTPWFKDFGCTNQTQFWYGPLVMVN